MAISPHGTFHVTGSMEPDDRGGWQGRGQSHQRPHPGLVGRQPTLRLSEGVLTLYDGPRPPAVTPGLGEGWFCCETGPAPEALLEAGCTLHVVRTGTGDVGLMITRDRRLGLALGAATALLGPFGVTLEVDPRTHEIGLSYVRNILARPDTLLLWLDPATSTLERTLRQLDELPPQITRVVAAVRSDDPATVHALNVRVMSPTAPTLRRGWRWPWQPPPEEGRRQRHRPSAMVFEQVSERFETAEDWTAYLRGLPPTRPSDLSIGFIVDGQRTVVREGEHAVAGPWRLYVQRVFTPGLPGQATLVGMAGVASPISPDLLQASAERLAGPLPFPRDRVRPTSP